MKGYQQYFRPALQNGCHVILLDQKPVEPAKPGADRQKTIDVWWKGDDTSRLMILLAYLITRNEVWESAAIRLLAFHLDVDNKENIQTLTGMLEEIRIDAIPQIVLSADAQTIVRTSKSADIVFIPVFLKENIPFIFENTPASEVIPGLKTIAFVMAAQKVELDTEPEEGNLREAATDTESQD
jgi:hypothetical protein